KSDLVGRLLTPETERAEQEIEDIRMTASSARKAVHELVSEMRLKEQSDEIARDKQIFEAADIKLKIHSETVFASLQAVAENDQSLCLKEAVTNVVKHSIGNICDISFQQSADAFIIEVQDDGIGIPRDGSQLPGSGLDGMRERLEFVNGYLETKADHGTILTITVPVVLKNITRGENE